MFISFDLDSFGQEVRKIRIKNKMSQKVVSEKTFIHLDTLRKLENGYTTPKYETLEILSNLYKTDLLLVLRDKRVNKKLLNFYTIMDDFLVNNTSGEIEALECHYSDFIHSVEFNNKIIDTNEIQQLTCFIEVCRLFYLGDTSSLYNAKLKIVEVLKFTESLEIECFNGFQPNEMELRLFYIYSIIEMIQKNYYIAINSLTYIISYLTDFHYNLERANQLIIKSYNNISYCYHLLDNQSEALKYANIGIQFALNQNLLYMLHSLFGRKTIAEKLLNSNDYLESYRKCIMFLELLNNKELLSTYKNIFKEIYNIV